MTFEVKALSEAAATKVALEGRFIEYMYATFLSPDGLVCTEKMVWKLEVPKRVFDPVIGYALAWAAQECGLLSARFAVVRHRPNAFFDGVEIK